MIFPSKDAGTKEVLDPRILIENYGSDSIRNFLIGEVNFGSDGPFTQEAFLLSFNNNLANTVGNVASRTLGMAEKYVGGIIGNCGNLSDVEKTFKEEVVSLKKQAIEEIKALKPTQSYNHALEILQKCNRLVDDVKPWELVKDGKEEEINTFLNLLCNAQLEAYTLLLPFLPDRVPAVFEKFGLAVPTKIDEENSFNLLKPNSKVCKGENLYSRLDVSKENEKLYKIANE